MKRTKLLPYLLLSNSVGVLVATSALSQFPYTILHGLNDVIDILISMSSG